MVYKKHREIETSPCSTMCFLFSYSKIGQKWLVVSYKGVSYKPYCAYQNLQHDLNFKSTVTPDRLPKLTNPKINRVKYSDACWVVTENSNTCLILLWKFEIVPGQDGNQSQSKSSTSMDLWPKLADAVKEVAWFASGAGCCWVVYQIKTLISVIIQLCRCSRAAKLCLNNSIFPWDCVEGYIY